MIALILPAVIAIFIISGVVLFSYAGEIHRFFRPLKPKGGKRVLPDM